MTDEELEAALTNWGRWCTGTTPLGECDSIEHNYRSPQEWDAPPPPSVPRGFIDRVSALAVNRAWNDMPHPYKEVLRGWYVLRRDPRRTCGRLHLAFSAHGEYLDRARLMCRNLLNRKEQQFDNHAASA